MSDQHEIRKTIVKTIQNLGYGKYRPYSVFSDWVEMTALALSNAVDKAQFEAREARYLDIVKRYEREEVQQLSGLLGYLVDAFSMGQDDIVFDDVLGDIFMSCDFGSDYLGQFFTPYHVSSALAQMAVIDTVQSVLKQRDFIRMSEPTCGSGGMCVASAQVLHEQGINYQQKLHITAHDIDPVCVQMAYIQMSLLHIPAVVILGNTLMLEERQRWYTPAHILGGWDWRLMVRDLPIPTDCRSEDVIEELPVVIPSVKSAAMRQFSLF